MNNQNYPLASLDNKKITIPIFELPAVLGSNENTVDLFLPNEKVSMEHCIFEFINNRLTIRDLGSATGTFVNGVRLNPEMPYYIDNGDKVKIGKLKFVLHANYQALSAMVQEMMNQSVMQEQMMNTTGVNDSVHHELSSDGRIIIEAIELNDYEYDESEVEFVDIGLDSADKPRSYTNQIKKEEIEAALSEEESEGSEEIKETQTVEHEEMDDAIAAADEEALRAVSDDEGTVVNGDDSPEPDAENTAAVQLKWIDEESGDPVRIDMDHFPFSIGRKSDENDYAIRRKGISRKHMRFEEEDGEFYIIDDDSTNGIKLNGEKLNPGEKVRIENGDNIRAGGITFAVTIKQ